MTELMGDISIYEDLILAELLEGKTREEIVAALESSNRIEYDEHFILRKLREGKSREDIAKILKHKSYRTLDMFMRRRGYRWDGEQHNYLPEAKGPQDDYEAVVSGKAQQAIHLFAAGIDPKEIAHRVGMTDHRALAQYMGDKGYIWSSEKQNYVLAKGEIAPGEAAAPAAGAGHPAVAEGEPETEQLSKLERLEKLLPVLELIDRNKDL